MNEIEKTEGEIKVLQAKLELLKEMEKHKSPCEEAYKRVYGFYPETYEDTWSAFQDGYDAAFFEGCKIEEPDESVEDYLKPQTKKVSNEVKKLQEKNWYVDAKDLIESGTEPQEPEENKWKTVALLFGRKLPVILPYGYDELSPNAWYRWVVFNYDNYIIQRDIESGYYPTPPQTPEQIGKSLREAFKKVQQTEEWKETQRKIDSNYDDMVKNPPEFLKFELGKTLEELICKCMVDYNSIIAGGLLEDILNNIEKWLPDFQSHEGTQSASVIDLVDGYNDALTKIKSKLRNKK
jgi:hypothetical protein